jgi:hypothetical protein
MIPILIIGSIMCGKKLKITVPDIEPSQDDFSKQSQLKDRRSASQLRGSTAKVNHNLRGDKSLPAEKKQSTATASQSNGPTGNVRHSSELSAEKIKRINNEFSENYTQWLEEKVDLRRSSTCTIL